MYNCSGTYFIVVLEVQLGSDVCDLQLIVYPAATHTHTPGVHHYIHTYRYIYIYIYQRFIFNTTIYIQHSYKYITYRCSGESFRAYSQHKYCTQLESGHSLSYLFLILALKSGASKRGLAPMIRMRSASSMPDNPVFNR